MIHQIAFQSGFTIDQSSHDVAFPGFAEFEDDGVSVADVGVDHGVSADFESEGAGVAGDTKRGDVDGNAALALLLHVLGHAGGDVAVNRDVEDFPAVEFIRENDGTGFSGESLDDAFAFKRAQVAHGSGLAGKSKVLLDFTGRWHDALFALCLPQVIKDLLLAVGKFGTLHRFMNSVPSNKVEDRGWIKRNFRGLSRPPHPAGHSRGGRLVPSCAGGGGNEEQTDVGFRMALDRVFFARNDAGVLVAGADEYFESP